MGKVKVRTDAFSGKAEIRLTRTGLLKFSESPTDSKWLANAQELHRLQSQCYLHCTSLTLHRYQLSSNCSIFYHIFFQLCLSYLQSIHHSTPQFKLILNSGATCTAFATFRRGSQQLVPSSFKFHSSCVKFDIQQLCQTAMAAFCRS